MLFLSDSKGHSHGRFPWVSLCLVVINTAVFFAQVELGEPFTMGYSMVPEEISTGKDMKGEKSLRFMVPELDKHGHETGRNVEQSVEIKHYPGPNPIYLTLLTSMFMHGSFAHLFFNMWCLLIFSRNVECAMGHWLFLAFYLFCGLCADFAQFASDPHSIIPCLGASGAIAGVMGAYLSIYPFNLIRVWFIVVFRLPAVLVLVAWALLQYLSAVIDHEQAGGVAYWAHLGGFLAGFLVLRTMVFVLRRKLAKVKAKQRAAEAAYLAANPPPDPYAGFASMQVVRRMQEEQRKREQGQ